ncbi:MAG: hypothetical protein IKF78_12615 [Atopobiaceae bacterium]|nr:hypothetical protein [Atopobiaceae bacterium]
MSPWYVILFFLIIASYSLVWFGMRRSRNFSRASILMATGRVVEHDESATRLVYIGAGLGALAFIILLLLLFRVL